MKYLARTIDFLCRHSALTSIHPEPPTLTFLHTTFPFNAYVMNFYVDCPLWLHPFQEHLTEMVGDPWGGEISSCWLFLHITSFYKHCIQLSHVEITEGKKYLPLGGSIDPQNMVVFNWGRVWGEEGVRQRAASRMWAHYQRGLDTRTASITDTMRDSVVRRQLPYCNRYTQNSIANRNMIGHLWG